MQAASAAARRRRSESLLRLYHGKVVVVVEDQASGLGDNVDAVNTHLSSLFSVLLLRSASRLMSMPTVCKHYGWNKSPYMNFKPIIEF